MKRSVSRIRLRFHPSIPNAIPSDPKPARETLKTIVSSHAALVIPRTKRRPAVSIRSDLIRYARARSTRPSGPCPNPQKLVHKK